MGQTLQNLSQKKLASKPIFPNRFVVEICEKVHTHYRNLRIVSSIHDWVNIAEGFRDALDRWKKRGCPGTNKNNHIELCRKKILSESEDEDILVNLNKNLYIPNKDRIYSEGVEFTDPAYIHLKIRDLRLELSIEEFKELASAVEEANKRIKDSDISAMLQEARVYQEVSG